MAIKFPLEMRNGVQVRNITELRENFDVEKVVGYFLEGKLKTWLDARYYEDEAEAVAYLSKDDPNLAQKLCEIFGIAYAGSTEINPEKIAERNARINRLKQYTDDDEIIRNVDVVAFDQEELADLYDRGVKKIYLCEGEFLIPKSKQGLNYVLIGNVVVTGLPVQEHDEKKEDLTQQRIIEITEPIVMNSTQTKKYQDVEIRILSTIKCGGYLEFENCEIHCDKAENSSFIYSGLHSETTLGISGGKLIFRHCRIHYNGPKSKAFDYPFICIEKAELIFENCVFYGCEDMVRVAEGSEITLLNCSGQSLETPLLTGYGAKKIQISNCTFAHVAEPIVPDELHNDNRTALISAHGDMICITETTFEGFVKGVVGSSKNVSIAKCNFSECSAIVCNRANSAKVEDSFFEKCIHLFECVNLTLIKCDFSECYGMINTCELICESCNWKRGYVYFSQHIPGGGNSSFSNCLFQDIHYQKSFDILHDCRMAGYHYILLGSDEAIKKLLDINADALINAGENGKLSECTFVNITLGAGYIITCKYSTELRKCIFENCVTEQAILDKRKSSYMPDYDFTKPMVFQRFKKWEEVQHSYSIWDCKGIHK